jgi:hypothetical protein
LIEHERGGNGSGVVDTLALHDSIESYERPVDAASLEA